MLFDMLCPCMDLCTKLRIWHGSFRVRAKRHASEIEVLPPRNNSSLYWRSKAASNYTHTTHTHIQAILTCNFLLFGDSVMQLVVVQNSSKEFKQTERLYKV